MKSKKILFFAFTSITLFLSLSLFKIAHPGVQFDEIIFANAALGMVDESFVSSKIGRFPLYIVPYTGALKAYLFYPLFKIVTPSVFSVRIPLILLGALSLFLNFVFSKKIAGAKIAFGTTLFLALDASFINLLRHDVGPNQLEYFFKSAILLLLLYFFKNFSFKILLGIFLLAFLGVFNKLNFIWFVNSLFFGVFLVFFPFLKEKIKKIPSGKQGRLLFLTFFGYLFLAGFFFLISFLNDFFASVSGLHLFSKIGFTLSLLRDLITGNAFYNLALGDLSSSLDQSYFIFVLGSIFLGTCLLFWQRKKIKKTSFSFFLLFVFICFTLFFQIVLTKEATAPWHVFMLYPFWPFLLIFSFSLFHNFLSSRFSLKFPVFTFLVFLVLSFQIGKDFSHLKAYDQPTKNVAWSSSIYELSDYTKKQNQKFIVADWGIYNQLLAFYGKNDKYEEFSFKFKNPQLFSLGDVKKLKEALNSKDFFFITHSDQTSIFPEAKENLKKIAKAENVNLKLVKIISDGQKTVFEIYKPEKIQTQPRPLAEIN